MGIVPGFGLCEDICRRTERFFMTMKSHPVTKYIISGLMFINYYTQDFYQKANIYGRELYYKYIDTKYEVLSIRKAEEHGIEIDTMYYSNYKTDQYLTLKSNTFTFTEHSLQDPVTKKFLSDMLEYRNPMLSAILAIKDKVNNNEFSIEVNKILEPFMFPGNTILGSKHFLVYLIHTYYTMFDKNNDDSKTCIALENIENLKDFSISLTYITLDEVGITTIPEMCDTKWKLSITDENKISLELE